MAYYNYDRICSYNACFNFILTNRGYGKSYGAKKRAITRFKKYGEQFVYVRRYKTELKKVGKFFDDIKHEFPNDEFKVIGYTFYMNKKVIGYAIPLSTSIIEKSTPYPLVTSIIFEEFIIDKGNLRYLNNEVDIFLELFSTIARKRNNVKAYFLANNISDVNPYFIYFDIIPKKGERFTLAKQGKIIIEKSEDDVFMEEMASTDFGIIVSGTKYGDYAINNQSLRDTDTFIQKIPLKQCTPLFNILYKGQYNQVWLDKENYLYYCNSKYVESSETLSLSMLDHSEGGMLSLSKLKYSGFDDLVKYFQVGKVRFENQQIKSQMYEIFSKLGVR